MTKLSRTTLPGLRSLTRARVALATTGHSIATTEVLDFQLAHAKARNAVHATLHLPSLSQRLRDELLSLRESSVQILELQTNAPDRATYLRHPNLGRTLHPASAATLERGSFDLSISIADGLSALAIERNAIPVLAELLPRLFAEQWSIAPLTLVTQGRVAIGDPIGFLLGARCSLVLIGERPGLSSPDSLGAYLTWSPHPDRTDANRNCISNIHDGGLAPQAAAGKLHWYLRAARVRQLSGVALKEGELELEAKGPKSS